MAYDFDRIIDRTNTDSLKYDFARRRGYPEDILPLWVADMDFQAPQEVMDAMVAKSQHGIFGYSEGREDYFEAVAGWYERYFHWRPKRQWLLKTPGVVFALAMAVQAYTEKGDAVLIQEPVYYPFRETVVDNERHLVVNQLVYEAGGYRMDLADFEAKIVANDVKLFILCSPHNPVGRVWREEELVAVGDICLRHGVLVVADEIHADFTYPGHTHHIFADLKPEFGPMTITCTAPTKTFNLAALQISNVFIEDQKLRRRFRTTMAASGYSQPGIMGLVSCQAAYTHGHEWLDALKGYLKGNLDFFRRFLKTHIPTARLIEPEGTYLVWVDVSKIPAYEGMTDKEIDKHMVQEARLWLDGGTMFGRGGDGFQRFNIACPRAILERALLQWRDSL